MPSIIDYDTQGQHVARAIVTQWLGEFYPPPQIDFQQSEILQLLITRAVAAVRINSLWNGRRLGFSKEKCEYYDLSKIIYALRIARSWMPQSPTDDMPLAQSDLVIVDAALKNLANE